MNEDIDVNEIRRLFALHTSEDEAADYRRLVYLLTKLIRRIESHNGDSVQRICFNGNSPKILVTMNDVLHDDSLRSSFADEIVPVEEFVDKLLQGNLTDTDFLKFLEECQDFYEEAKNFEENSKKMIKDDFEELEGIIENTVTLKLAGVRDDLKKKHVIKNMANYKMLKELKDKREELLESGSKAGPSNEPAISVIKSIIDGKSEAVIEEEIRKVLEESLKKNTREEEMRSKLKFYKIKKAFANNRPVQTFFTDFSQLDQNNKFREAISSCTMKISEVLEETFTEEFIRETMFKKHSTSLRMSKQETRKASEKESKPISSGLITPQNTLVGGELDIKVERGEDHKEMELISEKSMDEKEGSENGEEKEENEEGESNEKVWPPFVETNNIQGLWFDVLRQKLIPPYEDVFNINSADEIEMLEGEDHEVLIVELQGEQVSKEQMQLLFQSIQEQKSLRVLELNLSRISLSSSQVEEMVKTIKGVAGLQFLSVLLNGYPLFHSLLWPDSEQMWAG